MKTPSGTGGGYRRKADQDTLGRNSRMRYSTYIPNDKRMVPHGSARLFQNQNRSSGRVSQPILATPGVSIRFAIHNDGFKPNFLHNTWLFWLTSVSALTGTNYDVYEEIEVPDANYSVSYRIGVNNSKEFLETKTRPDALPFNLDGEYFIDAAHRHKFFVPRRFRISFYNLDTGTAVYERSTQYTPYFCYSPIVRVSINSSILYGDTGTVFTASSGNSKLVTRFDTTFSGDSETELFRLQFIAGSTTLINSAVLYQTISAFDPTNNPPSSFDLELTQTGGFVHENYAVNNIYAQLEPIAWPSLVEKTFEYGWDPWWDEISVSPSSLTTFDISHADFELSEGHTLTNPWKTFNIDITTFNATNVTSVGANIQTGYLIWCKRAGRSIDTTYLAISDAYTDPAISAPTTAHSNVSRAENSAAGDDIRGPIIAYVQAFWGYTDAGVFDEKNEANQVAMPPYFNTIDIAIQNQTNDSYDIVVTHFDGFTAFNQNGASGETPYWNLELSITDGLSSTVLFNTDIQYNGTVPFTLKQVSRVAGSPDLSWFPASYTGVHNMSIKIDYTFNTNGFNYIIVFPTTPFTVHTAVNVATTDSFTAVPLLVDLIGINNLITFDSTGFRRILDQVPYYSSTQGNDYDVKRAFDSTYNVGAWADWVAYDASNQSEALWAWIDLKQIATVKRVRLWQSGSIAVTQTHVKSVKLYITDTSSEATGKITGSYFFDFTDSTHRANCSLYYTDGSGSYQPYDAINNYTHVGSEYNDPTGSITKSASTGFWEFDFDTTYFTSSDRTGRYLYIQFDRTTSSKQPILAQAQVLGYLGASQILSLNGDLIGIDKLSTTAQSGYKTILDQSTYATFGALGNADYDVKRAFDNVYQVSGLQDWVAYDTQQTRLWAWIDLKQEVIVKRLRLWQVASVPHAQHRIKHVKVYITNESTEASGEWQHAHSFDYADSSHRQNMGLYYTDSSGGYVTYDIKTPNPVNDYDDVGKDSLDPTLAITNSVSTGFWEFDFDNSYFPSSVRTGRYLYIRFDRRYSGGQPRLAQAQVLGRVITDQPPPSYTSSNVSIINQTSVSFDIVLTSLVADSTITYDIEFEVVRPDNPNNLPHKAATTVQVSGNVTNHLIYRADRLLQDTDWWRGDPNAHTFNVIVRVKYGNHVYNTHTVTTQSFPPALIWRFKGDSSCLSDIDGHGLTWVINNPNTTITYNANDIELAGPGFFHDLRLYNTNNIIDDKCTNIGLFRNATFGIRVHPVVTSSPNIFNITGLDPAPNTSGITGNWNKRLYNLQLYDNYYTASGHRTSGLYRSDDPNNIPPLYLTDDPIQHGWSYNFYYNQGTTYTKADFDYMRTYETGVTGVARNTRFATANSVDNYFVKHSGGGGGTLNTPLYYTNSVIYAIYDNDNEGVGMVGGTHLVDSNGVTRSHSSFGTVTGYNGVTSGGSQDANYIECKFYNSGGKLEGIYLYPH